MTKQIKDWFWFSWAIIMKKKTDFVKTGKSLDSSLKPVQNIGQVKLIYKTKLHTIFTREANVISRPFSHSKNEVDSEGGVVHYVNTVLACSFAVGRRNTVKQLLPSTNAT